MCEERIEKLRKLIRCKTIEEMMILYPDDIQEDSIENDIFHMQFDLDCAEVSKHAIGEMCKEFNINGRSSLAAPEEVKKHIRILDKALYLVLKAFANNKCPANIEHTAQEYIAVCEKDKCQYTKRRCLRKLFMLRAEKELVQES
jgi:hypothetical protein